MLKCSMWTEGQKCWTGELDTHRFSVVGPAAPGEPPAASFLRHLLLHDVLYGGLDGGKAHSQTH